MSPDERPVDPTDPADPSDPGEREDGRPADGGGTAGETGGGTDGETGGPARKVRKLARHTILQRLVDLYDEPRYLEVGVCEGYTFDRVPAPRKVAVDPAFRFDHEQAERDHPGTSYHQVTSDDYFAHHVGPDELFDVIYLDGLHVYEQTLRDLMNALAHLQPQGVILIDDTRPPTYLASLPDRENFFTVRSWMGVTDQRWMGDVFKVVYFLESFCPHLTFRTVTNNHGQTLVWRAHRSDYVTRSLAEITALDFEQLVLTEDTLNLTTFGEARRELRRDLGI